MKRAVRWMGAPLVGSGSACAVAASRPYRRLAGGSPRCGFDLGRRSPRAATLRSAVWRWHPQRAPDVVEPSADRVVAATLAAEDRRFGPILASTLSRCCAPRARTWPNAASSKAGRRLASRWPSCCSAGARRIARGVREKIREAVLALRLEHCSRSATSRDVLNLAAHGNQLTASAAPATRIRPRSGDADAGAGGILAGLPQRPTGYNPHKNLLPRRSANNERSFGGCRSRER